MKIEGMKTKIKLNEKPTSEFYSQIINSLEDYSIFTLDNELIINSWSDGSAKIFGYSEDEAIGKHFNLIFSEEDLKKGVPKREIETALIEGRATDNRWHVTKDKNWIFSNGLIFPIINSDGEMLGFVKILQDLTERRKAEDSINKYVKELEELQAHKENVLSILSHDLRNSLIAIIGIADYLKSYLDTIEPKEHKDFLEIIYASSKNELTTLDYLLEWARIKSTSEVFFPTKIFLIEYVEKVFENLKEAVSISAITLHHELEENTFVFADGQMLISIIQNIVSNSIKHTGKGGKIIISAKKSDNSLVIQVKDTGIGISKAKQEKLFKPQSKKLPKNSDKIKEDGIELLLVKGFIEKNGGKIWVESKEGEGSSFYFSLPIIKPLSIIGSSDLKLF